MLFGEKGAPQMEHTEVTVPDAKTIGLWAGIAAGVVGLGAVAGVLIGRKDRNKTPQNLPMTRVPQSDSPEPEIPEGEPLQSDERPDKTQ